MSVLQAIGKVFAANRSLESAAVWLGHAMPGSRIVQAFCDRVGAQISHREPSAVRTAFTRFGAYLSVRMNEPVSRHIYFHGEYEPKTTAILQKLVRPGQSWLEMGGNAGFFTMLFSKGVGDTGHVHVIEPNPAIMERIQASIVLNGGTNVHLASVGTSPALATNLDEFLERLDVKPAFMKVSNEAFEMNAFRGLERTMRNHPPKLIIAETNESPGAVSPATEIIAYLVGFEYVPFRIGEGGLEQLVMDVPVSAKETNFVFIQKTVTDEFKQVLRK